jgi:hypothetical protein
LDYSAALIGAGVGLAFGALIPRMKPVYRAPEDSVSAQPSRAASSVHASLLEDLALRINLNDWLLVEEATGGRTTGRLTHLAADEIALQTAAGEKHFTRETIRQVAVRRQPIRMAVLIGAGAGACAAAPASPGTRCRRVGGLRH